MSDYKWDTTKTDFVVLSSHNFEDLTGMKFNRLTPQYPIRRKGLVEWVCLCECGKTKIVPNGRLKNGNTKSCGCYKSDYTKEKNRKNYKGIEDLSGEHINNILYSAKNRNIEYNITKEYLWSVYINQGRKCALSGLDIKFGKRFKGEEITASLDRIDSSKGYIEGNVQWIHKEINKMKFTKSDEHFVYYCTLIADYHRRNSNE